MVSRLVAERRAILKKYHPGYERATYTRRAVRHPLEAKKEVAKKEVIVKKAVQPPKPPTPSPPVKEPVTIPVKKPTISERVSRFLPEWRDEPATVTGRMFETKMGRFIRQKIVKPVYLDIKREPVKTAAIFAVSAALPLTPIAKVAKRVPKIAKAVKYGLPTAYTGAKAVEVAAAPPKERPAVIRRAVTTEILPAVVGTRAGVAIKRAPTLRPKFTLTEGEKRLLQVRKPQPEITITETPIGKPEPRKITFEITDEPIKRAPGFFRGKKGMLKSPFEVIGEAYKPRKFKGRFSKLEEVYGQPQQYTLVEEQIVTGVTPRTARIAAAVPVSIYSAAQQRALSLEIPKQIQMPRPVAITKQKLVAEQIMVQQPKQMLKTVSIARTKPLQVARTRQALQMEQRVKVIPQQKQIQRQIQRQAQKIGLVAKPKLLQEKVPRKPSLPGFEIKFRFPKYRAPRRERIYRPVKGVYKPSLLGLEYEKLYKMTIPKAPKFTPAVGIRLPVKKKAKKKRRKR